MCGNVLTSKRARKFCSSSCQYKHIRRFGIPRPAERINHADFYPENIERTQAAPVMAGDGERMNECLNTIGKIHPKAATISEREFKIMLDCCEHKETICLLWLLWESGCRAREIMDLRAGDVERRDGYFILHVDGKTGSRSVPVMNCTGIVAGLLEGRDAGDPLFPRPYISYHTRLIRINLKARKLGMGKRVTFHSFRHNRASQLLREGMPEQLVKKVMGWSPNSPMLNVYSHIVAGDVVDCLMRMNHKHQESIRPAFQEREYEYDPMYA